MKNHPVVNRSVENPEGKMLPLTWAEEIFCYCSLGLICGCVQICLILLPIWCALAYWGWMSARIALLIYFILAFHPLSSKPRPRFYYSWVFALWRKYFAYSWVNYAKLEKGKKYMFLEMPHGIFPMGQFISASCVRHMFGDEETIVGIGADVIFYFPILRHIMSFCGTRPAKRKNITKIFDTGHHCTILPGGIAEMYLCDSDVENVFLKNRKGAIKAALQEGANIIPAYFYGNSRLFTTYNKSGTLSWMSRISRKIQASIVFYTGRHFLPVPFRHPLKMVAGPVIPVERPIANPSQEQIDELHAKVMDMVKDIYYENRPDWEKNELVIN